MDRQSEQIVIRLAAISRLLRDKGLISETEYSDYVLSVRAELECRIAKDHREQVTVNHRDEPSAERIWAKALEEVLEY